MKTTLKFVSSASLNYQKYGAEVVLELEEGEKLTPADKEKYQNYVNEVATKKVTELAEKIEEVKNTNPSINIDKMTVTPTNTTTNVGGGADLTALKSMSGGQSRSGAYFVRNGNHTLGEATLKELQYLANLTAKSYEAVATAAKTLIASGFNGV